MNERGILRLVWLMYLIEVIILMSIGSDLAKLATILAAPLLIFINIIIIGTLNIYISEEEQ